MGRNPTAVKDDTIQYLRTAKGGERYRLYYRWNTDTNKVHGAYADSAEWTNLHYGDTNIYIITAGLHDGRLERISPEQCPLVARNVIDDGS